MVPIPDAPAGMSPSEWLVAVMVIVGLSVFVWASKKVIGNMDSMTKSLTKIAGHGTILNSIRDEVQEQTQLLKTNAELHRSSVSAFATIGTNKGALHTLDAIEVWVNQAHVGEGWLGEFNRHIDQAKVELKRNLTD